MKDTTFKGKWVMIVQLATRKVKKKKKIILA